MDVMVHVANLVYFASFTMRDILRLRVLTVIAASCLIPYYYFQTEPLLPAIYWNLVFVALNLYWIGRIVLERRPVQLSEDEVQLCKLVFHSLTPREMLKLLRLAHWEDVPVGKWLVEAGKKVDRLRVIYSGRARVEAQGKPITELGPGELVGQMSFITDEPAPVHIVAAEPTRCVTWYKSTLRDFLNLNPDLRAAFQVVLGVDLSHRVKAAWKRQRWMSGQRAWPLPWGVVTRNLLASR